MCGKMSEQGDWQLFKGRAALLAVSPVGFDSRTRGACPSPGSMGVRGDLCLPLLNTCSAEVKFPTPALS